MELELYLQNYGLLKFTNQTTLLSWGPEDEWYGGKKGLYSVTTLISKKMVPHSHCQSHESSKESLYF